MGGITGSGKSTTIASILNDINSKRRCHILTIEDPIEYVFTDDKSLINQREIGIDVINFAEALRSAVREDPDVMLLGEMRDAETFETALPRPRPATWCSAPSTRRAARRPSDASSTS